MHKILIRTTITILLALQICALPLSALATETTGTADSASTSSSSGSNASGSNSSGSQASNKTAMESFDVGSYLTVEGQKKDFFNSDQQSGAVQFIMRIIDILIRLMGGVAVLILVIAGLMLITANGNEQQLDNGKNMLKYSLIGLAVALGSFIIISFVNNVLSTSV